MVMRCGSAGGNIVCVCVCVYARRLVSPAAIRPHRCHGESGFTRCGHPRALSTSARGIPECDTRSEYGIPSYSPWVILHPLDGTGAGARTYCTAAVNFDRLDGTV